MISEGEYRGIQFLTLELGDGMARWTFYPKLRQGKAQRGVVRGRRDIADATCKNAIDAWLDDKILGDGAVK